MSKDIFQEALELLVKSSVKELGLGKVVHFNPKHIYRRPETDIISWYGAVNPDKDKSELGYELADSETKFDDIMTYSKKTSNNVSNIKRKVRTRKGKLDEDQERVIEILGKSLFGGFKPVIDLPDNELEREKEEIKFVIDYFQNVRDSDIYFERPGFVTGKDTIRIINNIPIKELKNEIYNKELGYRFKALTRNNGTQEFLKKDSIDFTIGYMRGIFDKQNNLNTDWRHAKQILNHMIYQSEEFRDMFEKYLVLHEQEEARLLREGAKYAKKGLKGYKGDLDELFLAGDSAGKELLSDLNVIRSMISKQERNFLLGLQYFMRNKNNCDLSHRSMMIQALQQKKPEEFIEDKILSKVYDPENNQYKTLRQLATKAFEKTKK